MVVIKVPGKLLAFIALPESDKDVVRIDGINVIIGNAIGIAVTESKVWIGKIRDDVFIASVGYSFGDKIPLKCSDKPVVRFEEPNIVVLFSEYDFNTNVSGNVRIAKVQLDGCYMYIIIAKNRINALKEGLRDIFSSVNTDDKFRRFIEYIEKVSA